MMPDQSWHTKKHGYRATSQPISSFNMSVHDDRANPHYPPAVPAEPTPVAVALPTKRSPVMVLLRWLPIAVILVLSVFGAMAVIAAMKTQP